MGVGCGQRQMEILCASLELSGGLSAYIDSKSYLPFAAPIAPTEGFWANVGPLVLPPAQLAVDGGSARVTVAWSAVEGATAYNVYYSTAPGVTKTSGTKISGYASPYVVRNLNNGIPYYVVVTAVGSTGESVVSKEKTATPAVVSPPLAPLNPRAEAGSGQIVVRWDASDGATSYNLYHAAVAGVTKASGTKVTGVNSPYTLTPLASDTARYAVVTAVGAAGESGESFEVTATPSPTTPPPAPANVRAALDGTDPGKVVLNWNASDYATKYTVYYGSAWGVTKQTGTRIDNVTSPYTISGLTRDKAAYFVVTASNGNGESADSAQVAATPRTAALPAFGQRMVPIPSGSFQMGDNLDAITYAQPVITVAVSSFYIDRFETGYDLWKQVYDWAVARGYAFDRPGTDGFDVPAIGTDMPVTAVSWYDTVKWLNARSEMEGQRPAYYTDVGRTSVYRSGQTDLTNAMVDWAACGYRLPTEAEWEKSSRGGLAGKRYPWGDDPADPNLVGIALANYNMGRTTSLGVYPVNGYGLHDMAGNVWEWTWNWWTDDYSALSANDPHGPEINPVPYDVLHYLRVRRGGGMAYGPAYLRNAERVGRLPTYTARYFGFRSARSCVP